MIRFNRFWLSLPILLVFSLIARSVVNAQGTLRVNINFIDSSQFPLLDTYVSVTDAQGFPVRNLTASDFSLSEDMQDVLNFEVTPIQNMKQPLAVALVIDTSGSMGGDSLPTPLQNVAQAAKTFVNSLSPQDQVAIVGFASSSYVVQDFTDDKGVISAKLDSLTYGGNTTMYDGIVQAINLLKLRSERQIIVLITDGKDTGGGQFDQFDFVESINEASRWGVPIFPIGFGQVDRNELEKIAILTGGVSQISPNSLDTQSAFNMLSQILRDQYLIQYVSTIPADAIEHSLNVSVDGVASSEWSFIAWPSEITISSGFQDGGVISGDVLLKPKIIAPTELKKIEFILDGNLLQSIDSAPFEYSWNTAVVSPGLHQITLIATDNSGNTTQEIINLNVQPTITIDILSPVDGQEMTGLSKVVAEINAVSGITEVEYSIDEKKLQILKEPPYEIGVDWDNYSKGMHWLQVKATDFSGVSSTQKISVQIIDGLPRPTLISLGILAVIDEQNNKLSEASIAIERPEQMEKDETTSIELTLNPLLSKSSLETSQIETTPRTIVKLLPQDPDAFIVNEMHDNEEQVISFIDTTTWRWSIIAKKEGLQTLELVIYKLDKYDGKDYWREVETYKVNIVVEVTPLDKVKSLDWKWFLGFLLAFVSSVLGVLSWLSNKKKKADEEKPIQRSRKKKNQP